MSTGEQTPTDVLRLSHAETDAASVTSLSAVPRPAWALTPEPPTPEELLASAAKAVGDRYRIEHHAGSGGQGRVFAARDVTLERRVAIKLIGVLDPNPAEDPGMRAHDRLVGEARAMARLNHPRLCRVIEVSLQHELPYLVMDWVDGRDLRAAWAGLDLKRRLTLYVRVVEAVAALHAEGLIHGDLKPSNILVSPDGEPTIVDFGLTRAEHDAAWGPGVAGGTPGYSAPEQLDGARQVTTAADVFSLGVLLYELLTDRSPFPPNTSPAVLAELVSGAAIPPPERYAPDAPAGLQRICLTCMEPAPADRYTSARELEQDIRRYLRGETVAARPKVLVDRFDAQVDQQIARTREWRRLGLVTPREADAMLRTLDGLLRAESPWVIDARRLRGSQVSLYIGGWLILLGLVVGLGTAWEEIGTAAGTILAWASGAGLLGIGLRLSSTGEKRVGLAMLITAQLALPAALWLLLRETGALAGLGAGPSVAELVAGEPVAGLSNAQVLAVSLAGLAASGWLRFAARSSAFTLFAVASGAGAWLSLYGLAGYLDRSAAAATAGAGGWMAALGGALLLLGLPLDTRENDMVRALGRRRVRSHDAAPILGGTLLLLAGGLSAAAWAAPAWYLLRPAGEDDPTATERAWALLVNGAAYAVLAHVLLRRGTTLRRRLTEVPRWLLPAHVLGALAVLEHDDAIGLGPLWLASLAVASVAFCYASVLRQWKPFLFTGMGYLGYAYVRLFDRVSGEATTAAAAIAAVLAGVAVMMVAWKAPGWIARRRLAGWGRRVPPVERELEHADFRAARDADGSLRDADGSLIEN